jgi:hypothetical protein
MDGSIRELIEAMRDEIACFDDFSREQMAMSRAVRERDWVSLQKSLVTLESIAALIQGAEARREGILSELCRETDVAGEDGFYRFATWIGEPSRTALTDAYRALKVAALRVRIENDALGSSIDDARELLSGIFDELFPDRRGKLYGRTGRAVGRNLESVVVNTAM